MLSFITTRFSPLRSRLFFFLFFTQFFSQSGSWAFEIARTWIVVDSLGKGHELGMVMLSGSVSTLLFTLYGGALTDRFSYKQVLKASIVAKVFLFFLSLWLCFIVNRNLVSIWHLMFFSFIQGIIVAFDAPAFISIAMKLVSPTDLQQALALNSMNFQASRTLGPLLAGLLMGWGGPAVVILFDGVTFLGPALATLAVLIRRPMGPIHSDPTHSPKGFRTLLSDTNLTASLLGLYTVLSVFLPTLLMTFRVYIKDTFEVTSKEFSYVFTGPALGALMGAVTFALLKPKDSRKLLNIGIPLFLITCTVIPTLGTLSLTVFGMSIAGYAAYFTFSAYTVHLHLQIKESFRGRLTSVIMLGFGVVAPIMAYPIGKFIDVFSSRMALFMVAPTYLILLSMTYLLRLFFWGAKPR